MRKTALFIFFIFTTVSCEHRGETILDYTGDYRYFSGIGEFFDCKSRTKYFLSSAGVSAELETQYLALGINETEDVYATLRGYVKEETQIEGVDPITVFVPTEIISLDQTRGCEKGRREGQ